MKKREFYEEKQEQLTLEGFEYAPDVNSTDTHDEEGCRSDIIGIEKAGGRNPAKPEPMRPSSQHEPSLEQWKELYEAAKSIRQLAPWEYLFDMDLFTIMLPEHEEPVYCSVMGRAGECYGIGVYPGYASIAALRRMAESAESEPHFISAFEQNCLMCYFGNREEVSTKEREVLKSLNIRFRGRNEWIYFRSMEPGYYPWHLNSEQAKLMIDALQNLSMACMHYSKGKLTVDFENGETLLRFYSPEKKLWINTASKLLVPEIETPATIVCDDILIARLKKRKSTKARLEIDALYLPTPIQERKEDRPYLPRFLLLADKKSGMPLDQNMTDRDDALEDAVFGMLAKYIESFGRPASINVRDERIGRLIGDFCRKINVELIEGRGVPAVDNILDGLLGYL